MRYGIFKDGFERRSVVSESKSESVTEIMSESEAGENMCEWESKVLLSKLLDRVESCASLSEVEMVWSEVSEDCVSVSNKSEELSKMLQKLINEVCVKKESLRVEESVSLCEESYEYVGGGVAVPTVEVGVPVVAPVVAQVEAPKKKSAKVAKEKVVKEKVVKEKVVKEKKEKVGAASSEVVSSVAASRASSEAAAAVSLEVNKVAKDKKDKVVKEKVVKEKVVKEKKVKGSVYRGGVFASLVTAASSSEVREESNVESDVEEESSSRCYIMSKKESACAAAQKMSSELPKLSR
jgi:hypothetical protein